MDASKSISSIGILFLAILLILSIPAFSLAGSSGRYSSGSKTGHGNTKEEACANAEARGRQQCEIPEISTCQCHTFDPRSKWTCTVDFTCK